MKLISVIIPTYNRPNALRHCLEALASQTYTGNWEVIVVDDGSDLELSGIIGDFKASLTIRLLKQLNQGPATARNRGAKNAEGHYLAFLDDDCEPDKHWLASLAPNLKKGVLVGGRTENKLAANVYSEASQLLVFYLYDYFQATPWYFFTSNNFAMDKTSFLEAGGFDQSFRTSAGEDRAFCAYWAHLGHKLEYIPEAVVWHSHHQTIASFCQLHVKYGHAARQFRVRLLEWGIEPIQTQISFYTGLLVFAGAGQSKQYSVWFKTKLFLLLTLSQLCTAVGVISDKRQPI